MASGRFLLDTEVVVALLRGDKALAAHVGSADECFVSIVTLGELYYGALRSARTEDNLDKIEAFARATVVLAFDNTTASIYARIKDQLRSKGRPIPENDIWIAAIARQHSLTLVSSDAHFQEIDSLPVVEW